MAADAVPPRAAAAGSESGLKTYLDILRRRWLLVVAPTILIPLAVLLVTATQPARYQATATVYVKQQNPAALATGSAVIANNDPSRTLETQVALAGTPAVAARVLASAGVTDMSAADLRAATTISADPNADILSFAVTDASARQAAQLATAYATEYTRLRRTLDTQPLSQARAVILQQIARLPPHSAYAATLANSANQLQTQAALQGSNAVLAESASGATQVAPQTKKYTLLGAALGLVLGIGLAFLWEALDTRVRSAEEVAAYLGIPLLARIPEPPRELARANRLAAIEAPSSSAAESFRLLRTNLAFASVDQGTRVIMISSPVESEGKSTTVANLAIVEARAGDRVALLDLDFRRPKQHTFFHLEDRPGITNVLLGQATLEQATARIHIGYDDAVAAADDGSEGEMPEIHGLLDVIPCGPIPPNPGEIVAMGALTQILDTLAQRYDLVLVDTPPILHIGDTVTLASSIPSMILMTRLPNERRGVLIELARVLETCPARPLGFVVSGTDSSARAGSGYGYSSDYYRPATETRRIAWHRVR
jgi:polysaccharide biosynthesis transport protein